MRSNAGFSPSIPSCALFLLVALAMIVLLAAPADAAGLPPTAANDTYSTPEDTTLNVPAPGVLGNDSGNGPLTATLVSEPEKGTLTFSSDGSFNYTPNANTNGTDSFTYTANDADGSDIATVTINVSAVNDAPVAADDTASTNEDTPTTSSPTTPTPTATP